MFIIRHKPTGAVLSQAFTRGGTWWEPTLFKNTVTPPRVFATAKNARMFAVMWAKGQAKNTYNYHDEISGTYYTPVPGRNRSDLEIIPVTLTYGEPLPRKINFPPKPINY